MTTSGLNGVTAGSSAVSTVGQADVGLTYRGYSITDLAADSTFEEVAYLLIYGKLPNQRELDAYKKKLAGLRSLPDALKTLLEALPASTHPMDVLRTGTSLIGTLETEGEGGRTAASVVGQTSRPTEA
jgi:2-methylcitrate synthase